MGEAPADRFRIDARDGGADRVEDALGRVEVVETLCQITDPIRVSHHVRIADGRLDSPQRPQQRCLARSIGPGDGHTFGTLDDNGSGSRTYLGQAPAGGHIRIRQFDADVAIIADGLIRRVNGLAGFAHLVGGLCPNAAGGVLGGAFAFAQQYLRQVPVRGVFPAGPGPAGEFGFGLDSLSLFGFQFLFGHPQIPAGRLLSMSDVFAVLTERAAEQGDPVLPQLSGGVHQLEQRRVM